MTMTFERPQNLNPPAIVEQVKYQWEELVTLMMELRTEDDRTQIACGRLGVLARKQYGRHALKKLAIECNIKKSTINERVKVVEAFSDDALADYSILSFSHLRLCSRTETPLVWAKLACDNNWTVENLAVEIKKTTGELPTFNLETKREKILMEFADVKERIEPNEYKKFVAETIEDIKRGL